MKQQNTQPKKPRKVKTIADIIVDLHKLEKRVLNYLEKHPNSLQLVASSYMTHYKTLTAAQQNSYRRLASALKAR